MIVVISGLIGVGKTSIAKKFEKKGFKRICRDEYRDFMFKPVDFFEMEQKNIAYSAMLLVAEYYLKRKKHVIFDGMLFNHKEQVKAVIKLAKKTKTKINFFYFECPDDVALKRIKGQKHVSQKSRTKKDYFRVKKSFDPLKVNHTIIDTNRSKEKVFRDCWKLCK